MMRVSGFVVAVLLAMLRCVAQAAELPIEEIKLPPGFKIELLARVDNAREMALGAKGTLFVGSMQVGRVYALQLKPSGPPTVKVIASGLKMPVGVAFHDGALYVSAIDRIVRLDNIEDHLEDPPKPVTVDDHFPKETHHGWKFIAFGPDGKLYVPVGAPCNVCEPDFDRYANIQRMNADGSGREIYARGIRNSVGFDWDPRTKELWFTNNGRDMLGDDVPPDTLHHATKPGLNFGYPYCHGGTIADPEFGRAHPCSEFVAPTQALGAHVAAIGMRFYTGTQFPAMYRNQVFIAEHGSWNRSSKVGYRISLVRIDSAGKAVAYQPFASGWLQGESAWGRPADVLVAPDGALLVSDDTAGAIYRISYRGGP
jgi:glucose/arabinose dehydrogenase